MEDLSLFVLMKLTIISAPSPTHTKEKNEERWLSHLCIYNYNENSPHLAKPPGQNNLLFGLRISKPVRFVATLSVSIK